MATQRMTMWEAMAELNTPQAHPECAHCGKPMLTDEQWQAKDTGAEMDAGFDGGEWSGAHHEREQEKYCMCCEHGAHLGNCEFCQEAEFDARDQLAS